MTEQPSPPRDVIAEWAGRKNGRTHPSDYAYADSILSALVEAGYVVVPREPTDAMVGAAHDAWQGWFTTDTDILDPDAPLNAMHAALTAALRDTT